MIKSKLKQALTAVAFAVGAVGSANAFVISGGDIKITIDGFDIANVTYPAVPGVQCQNSTADCDAAGVSPGAPGMGSYDTMGIVSVGSITNASGSITYFSRGADGYLTGVFGGLLDRSAETACGILVGTCTTTVLAQDGYFKLYKNASQFDAALGPTGAGVDLLNGIYPGITDGVLYLSGYFASGALAGDTNVTYVNTFNNSTYAGGGQGFLNVLEGDDPTVVGTHAELFRTKSLTGLNDVNGSEKRDLFMDATFHNLEGVASDLGWTVKVTASIQGQAVPEPSALALVALAMIGAGAASTRRKAA